MKEIFAALRIIKRTTKNSIIIDKKKDKILVKDALEDAENFAAIIDKYEKRLIRYILRILSVNTQDAEDVLQEVFIKVYENLNDFDQSLKFSSWIYRITHNHAISFYRKRKNHLETLSIDDCEEIIKRLQSEIDTKNDVESKLTKEKVKNILKKLDKKYRDALILYFLEDKSYAEISNILKKPIGTIGTLINRAKKKFKEIYQSESITKKL